MIDSIKVFKGRQAVCHGYAVLATALLRSVGVYARTVGVEGHEIIEVLYPVYYNGDFYLAWIPLEPQGNVVAYGRGVYKKWGEGREFEHLMLCKMDCWLCKQYDCKEYRIVRIYRDPPNIIIGVKP